MSSKASVSLRSVIEAALYLLVCWLAPDPATRNQQFSCRMCRTVADRVMGQRSRLSGTSVLTGCRRSATAKAGQVGLRSQCLAQLGQPPMAAAGMTVTGLPYDDHRAPRVRREVESGGA